MKNFSHGFTQIYTGPTARGPFYFIRVYPCVSVAEFIFEADLKSNTQTETGVEATQFYFHISDGIGSG